jgi:hypothetical protein
MPPTLDDAIPDPLPAALTVRLYWLRVKVAVTFFAALMLVMTQVAAVDVPPVVSQLPDHNTVEPAAAVAVSVIAVP